MIKKMQQQILFLIFICLIGLSPAWGQGSGYIYTSTYSIWPSMPGSPMPVRTYLSCYDIFTGELLDCAITHKVIGLVEPKENIDNNGGHTHNYDTRPFIDPRNGILQFFYYDISNGEFVSGVDGDTSPLGVSGPTQRTIVMITHQMPQVAGKIVTESTVTSPSGWECASISFTRTMYKYEYTLNVRIPHLEPLLDPTPEEHYAKSGETNTHPWNHYGATNTLEKLKEIAKAYYKLSGRTLSVNDMSLPKGGLFDFEATWEPPHITHRTGTDADIDRKDISCYDDTELRSAVEKVAGEETRPYLQCENKAGQPVPPNDPTGWFKHIDF